MNLARIIFQMTLLILLVEVSNKGLVLGFDFIIHINSLINSLIIFIVKFKTFLRHHAHEEITWV